MVQGFSSHKGEDAAGSFKLPPDWSSEESWSILAFSMGILRILGSWGENLSVPTQRGHTGPSPWDFWPEQMDDRMQTSGLHLAVPSSLLESS